jgi:outer membrane receptor protein involved in Fe transport
VEVGALDDARYDVFEDNHLHLDVIAKVHLTPNLMVYGNALNLTDQPYYAYTHQARYNAQYERYGRTFQVGLSYTGF